VNGPSTGARVFGDQVAWLATQCSKSAVVERSSLDEGCSAVGPVETTPPLVEPVETTPPLVEPVETTPPLVEPVETTPSLVEPVETTPSVVELVETPSAHGRRVVAVLDFRIRGCSLWWVAVRPGVRGRLTRRRGRPLW
jgi:hypothetical protein